MSTIAGLHAAHANCLQLWIASTRPGRWFSVTISTRPALISIVDDPAPGTVSDFFDKARCAELHPDGRRCQLVRGHDGQHLLRRGDVNVAWPHDADPHDRPPWAVTLPRDES